MNLLLASAEFLPFRGGVAEVVDGLAEGLSEEGIDVTVLTRRTYARLQADSALFRLIGYPYSVRMVPQREILIAGIWLTTRFLTHQFIVAADMITQRALSLLPAGILAKRTVWLVAYGSEVLHHATVGSTSRRQRLFAECRGVVAISEYTARLVRQWFPMAQVHVVYPGIREELFTAPRDVTRIREIRESLRGRMLVLCLGRLDPRKGQDTLIRSLPYLRSMGPPLLVAFVGSGPYREELEHIVKETGSTAEVLFLGTVDDQEKLAWLDAADLVVQPSRQEGLMVEGLGLAMAEAGARGRPVLSSRHGGIPEVVLDGSTGILVPGDAPAEVWAKETLRLLQDSELRRRLGESGRKFVASTFRWSKACSRFKQLLAMQVEGGG